MARDHLDIPKLLIDVVAPVVGAMFRPGEVETLLIEWVGEPVPGPGSLGLPTELSLTIVAKGERFILPLWTVGEPVLDSSAARERLASTVQDFIAESSFGWGEERRFPID